MLPQGLNNTNIPASNTPPQQRQSGQQGQQGPEKTFQPLEKREKKFPIIGTFRWR
jgi:hypothetical protein